MPPLSEKISRYALSGCSWKELLELVEKVRLRVARETKRPVEITSCYEARYDGFWLHRLLERHGVRNYVVDPASMLVDRRARRVKTDNIDAAQLLCSLLAYLRRCEGMERCPCPDLPFLYTSKPVACRTEYLQCARFRAATIRPMSEVIQKLADRHSHRHLRLRAEVAPMTHASRSSGRGVEEAVIEAT